MMTSLRALTLQGASTLMTVLEQNIIAFLGLYKLTHRLTVWNNIFLKNITILHKWIIKHIVQPLQCSPIRSA